MAQTQMCGLQSAPGAVQVSDRLHQGHGLGEDVRKDVAAHCACWGTASR